MRKDMNFFLTRRVREFEFRKWIFSRIRSANLNFGILEMNFFSNLNFGISEMNFFLSFCPIFSKQNDCISFLSDAFMVKYFFFIFFQFYSAVRSWASLRPDSYFSRSTSRTIKSVNGPLNLKRNIFFCFSSRLAFFSGLHK